MKIIFFILFFPFVVVIYLFKFCFISLRLYIKQIKYNKTLDYDLIKILRRDGKFRKKCKHHLVSVTSHGETCSICQKWENKILIDDIYSGGSTKDGKYPLLSQAIEKGLFHKNCRHGLTTYYPEADNIENYSDKEYKDDVRYINHKIKNIILKKRYKLTNWQ